MTLFTTKTASALGAKGGYAKAQKMTKKARKAHSMKMLEAKKKKNEQTN